jgi:ribosome recycling factor
LARRSQPFWRQRVERDTIDFLIAAAGPIRPSGTDGRNCLGNGAMAADDILLDVEDRMEKAIGNLKNNLAGIRTGRANPGLVDSLKVEVYGSQTPMKQLASVGAPEPMQIVIRPYDPSTIKDIEKAIVNSGLGFAPQNDGRVIRINVPPLTTETRRKLVARIKELTEETKVAIRNVRRDGNKAAEQAEKDGELTEDQRDKVKEDVQELTKKYENTAGEMAKNREAEVMGD